MFRKISAIIADDHFVDYFWTALPVVLIVIGVIAVTAITIARAY